MMMILQTQITSAWEISFVVKDAAPKLLQDAKGQEFLVRTTVQIDHRTQGVETQVVVVVVVVHRTSFHMAAAHRSRPSLYSDVKVTVTQTATVHKDCTASKETVETPYLGVMGPMTRELITVYQEEVREVEVEAARLAVTLEVREAEAAVALPIQTPGAVVPGNWEQRLALTSPMSLS